MPLYRVTFGSLKLSASQRVSAGETVELSEEDAAPLGPVLELVQAEPVHVERFAPPPPTPSVPTQAPALPTPPPPVPRRRGKKGHLP